MTPSAKSPEKLIQGLNWGEIDGLPWVHDNLALEEIHKYILKTKQCSQPEFTAWKVLKKSMQNINSSFTAGVFHMKEIGEWVAISSVVEHIGVEVRGLLSLESSKA